MREQPPRGVVEDVALRTSRARAPATTPTGNDTSSNDGGCLKAFSHLREGPVLTPNGSTGNATGFRSIRPPPMLIPSKHRAGFWRGLSAAC